jgi:16S rRNA (guanine966-N2)-methyltransferase
MLRVTAGTLRNRRVPVPPADVRPTSERARQAFFNIAGDRLLGARFLDLFAGSGIFSFEALSRGAASALAIDRSRRHTEQIARLATEWAVDVRAVTADVLPAIKRLSGPPFDVIYADPPYDYGQYDDLLAAVGNDLPLAPGALVAIEHRRRTEPFSAVPDALRFLRRAEYGEVWISLYEAPPRQLQ